MQIDWTSFLTQASQVTTDLVGSVATATMGVASGVLTFVMSLIFAVYMLFSKEKLIKNLKRVLYAFCLQTGPKVISVGSLASNIFSGFVTGQVTEALILRLPVLSRHEYHPAAIRSAHQRDSSL